ncbi:hypothetical protein BaRGS_00028556 [Batillaria attramentaria]|uniref:Mitochondrial import inner membrane translocase subunit n=1 Tax=Batillaria attramentaria TaxID=370345 RepID=A0ABD0JYP5_9CAEN
MDFSSPPAGGSMGSADKEHLMDQVKQQIALANAQELLQKMSEKCYKKCISKPGSTLDNSEQSVIVQPLALNSPKLQTYATTVQVCRESLLILSLESQRAEG